MLIHAHILSARLLPVAVATYTWSMTDPNRAKLMAVLEMVLIFVYSILISVPFGSAVEIRS